MRRIKLMADYECHPLWTLEEGQVHDNLDPETLPISDVMKHDLRDWAELLDATLDWRNPAGTAWPRGFWAQFNARGAELAERLQAELGTEVEVQAHFWGDDSN